MLIYKTAPILLGFSMGLWAKAAIDSNKKAYSNALTKKNSSSISFQSEYNMEWHRIGTDDSPISLVGRHNSQVVGGYETRLSHKAFGIKIGASRKEVTKIYGTPLKAIHYQTTSYLLHYIDCTDNVAYGTYLINQHYVTFFYDLHKKI